MKTYVLCGVVLLMTSCSRDQLAFDAWANCQGLNLQFGIDQYAQCVENEKWRLSDQVQQEEFKRLEQYQKDHPPIID